MLKTLIFITLLCSNAFAQNGFEQAKKLFEDAQRFEAEKILKNLPQKNETIFLLGKIYYYEGNYEKANEQFEKIISQNPNVGEYHLWSGKNNSKRVAKVNFLKKAFIANSMKNDFKNAIKLEPNNLEARISLFEFYLQAPMIAGGSVSKAKNEAKAIFKFDKIQGLIAESRIEEVDGLESKAEKILLEAKKEFSNEAELNFALVQFYKRTEQNEKYIQALIEISKIFPNEKSSTFFELGLTEQRNENYKEAFEFFEKSIQADSTNFASYYQFARTSIFANLHLEKGRDYLTNYIQNNRDNSSPSKSWANFRLGLIYEKLKDFDKAKFHFKESLRFNPKNEKAKKALKKIELN
ncbi:MAG: tetratricopeptide repeat protein [Calditrichaeota bacterium]|nr:MAG: tetratricopeptide repeat protein [Calditrichota bacterium]